MKARLDPRKAAPDAMKSVSELQAYVFRRWLDHALVRLAKVRASQINGRARSMHTSTKGLRAAGESEQRLYLLSAWRKWSFNTERERGARLGRCGNEARQCPL